MSWPGGGMPPGGHGPWDMMGHGMGQNPNPNPNPNYPGAPYGQQTPGMPPGYGNPAQPSGYPSAQGYPGYPGQPQGGYGGQQSAPYPGMGSMGGQNPASIGQHQARMGQQGWPNQSMGQMMSGYPGHPGHAGQYPGGQKPGLPSNAMGPGGPGNHFQQQQQPSSGRKSTDIIITHCIL